MVASTVAGGATKPNQAPAGVKGTISATTSAVSDEVVSMGSARLLHGRPLVRMMKMTRIWVAMDSRNQAVRNSSGVAWNRYSSAPKVRKSNSDDSGPMIAAKRSSRFMSQRCGRAVACGLTRSNGMPSSERS